MGTSFLYSRTGHVVSRGEGLRPVLRYVRRSPVVDVDVDYCLDSYSFRNQYPYRANITYADGTWCVTRWSDWRVLQAWLLARRWKGYRLSWSKRLPYCGDTVRFMTAIEAKREVVARYT